MTKVTRWVTDLEPGHSQRYIDRFRQMAAEGRDLAGEARLLDAIVAPGSRILDAGCGPGRVAAALAARGHHVVGVDADPVLIEAARADHPTLTWVVGDLTDIDLADVSAGTQQAEPFDAVVVAGNVMVYVAPGTEGDVLRRLAALVKPDGPVVVGFTLTRDYRLPAFDADAVAAGLVVEQRFATWDLRPWHGDADFAVTVLRRPA